MSYSSGLPTWSKEICRIPYLIWSKHLTGDSYNWVTQLIKHVNIGLSPLLLVFVHECILLPSFWRFTTVECFCFTFNCTGVYHQIEDPSVPSCIAGLFKQDRQSAETIGLPNWFTSLWQANCTTDLTVECRSQLNSGIYRDSSLDSTFLCSSAVTTEFKPWRTRICVCKARSYIDFPYSWLHQLNTVDLTIGCEWQL